MLASAWDPATAGLLGREPPLLSWDTGVCMRVTFTEEVPSSWSPGPPHQAEWVVPECFPPSLGPTRLGAGRTPHTACFFKRGGGREQGLFCLAAASTLHVPCSLVSRAGGHQLPGRRLAPRPAPVMGSRE